MHSPQLLQAWWRLCALPGMGTVGLNRIRTQLNSPSDLIQCKPQDLINMGLNAEKAQRWYSDSSLLKGCDTLIRWQSQNPEHQGLLLAGTNPYPEALLNIKDAPIFLFYRGNLEALNKPMVAMVGSRNPTPYAQEWAQHTASELAVSGVTVVSGMALGIDGFAHTGALQTGSTIAVLGSGADVYYPKRHAQMALAIEQQGLILSEFLPGTPPQARHFPSRNRLVSGLSQACVVVEAAQKSGSLITAKLAAEQGREVLALPGAVTNPLSAGCHELIRDGALLVRDAQDILEELRLDRLSTIELVDESDHEPMPSLLQYIDFSETDVDTIQQRSSIDISELMPQLLDLELSGWIQMGNTGYLRVR